jgi:hypothetical protein
MKKKSVFDRAKVTIVAAIFAPFAFMMWGSDLAMHEMMTVLEGMLAL